MERTSVIIPTFNRADLLAEAVESVLAQTFQPGEIIIADDGSSDHTSEVAARFSNHVRYVHKENSGKADTLNTIIPTCQHPLIWIMDDDDIAAETALEALTKPLDGRPHIGLSYGRYKRFEVDPASGDKRFFDCGFWSECEPDAFFATTLEDFFVHHPGMLVRKSVYEKAGPFSTKYPRLEDYEMLVRLARITQVAQTDECVFYQRQHDGDRVGGLAASNRTQRWIDEEKDFFIELHSASSLCDFLPGDTPAFSMDCEKTREALIRRACVMARKKLWDLAFDDFEIAIAQTDAPECLTEQETNAIRRALFSKYGNLEVINDAVIAQRLTELSQNGPVGRAIAKAFARAMLFFIRTNLQSQNWMTTWKYARLTLKLL